MAAKKFVQCHCGAIPALPDGITYHDAAKHAVSVYAGNAPTDLLLASYSPGDRAGAGGGAMEEAKITILTSKWWGPKVDLDVKFLDTNNSQLKAKILEYANKWSRYGNIQFRETMSSTATIRLSVRPGDGHYAYLGTDMRLIPTSQKNMNLDSFSMSTPDSEFDRVVCHEFGHVLGCPHEQSRPEVMARLDRAKTYAYYAQRYGWGKATVDSQIFSPLDPNSIWATAPDETSIMCYQFPAQCTKNGLPIPGGFNINPLDGKLIAERYPKDDPVEPPPPVGETKSVKVSWGGFTEESQKAMNNAGLAGFNFTVSVGPPNSALPEESESWVSDLSEYASDLLAKVESLADKYGKNARSVLAAAKAFLDDPGFLTAAELWAEVQSLLHFDDELVVEEVAAPLQAPRLWDRDWAGFIRLLLEVLAKVLTPADYPVED